MRKAKNKLIAEKILSAFVVACIGISTVVSGCSYPTMDNTNDSGTLGTDEQMDNMGMAVPVEESAGSAESAMFVEMSWYSIAVEGNSLVQAVALAEDDDVWLGTPAYVFVGERKPGTEQNKVSLAVAELLRAAMSAAENWGNNLSDDFMSSCQVIPTDRYIIAIGDDRYAPLAAMFEAAANDETVLDMEDLLNRLTTFEISREEKNEMNKEVS